MVEIIIKLRDGDGGQVQIEEIRRPGADETEESVTIASALADEMLSLVSELGDTDA